MTEICVELPIGYEFEPNTPATTAIPIEMIVVIVGGAAVVIVVIVLFVRKRR
ncbi:MAG: hypothetical protein GQ580_07855 [Candidatus Thorarchaeota archaeon]|nr:hypothetical protein [Candidatus Thorarchaeota archaeon]